MAGSLAGDHLPEAASEGEGCLLLQGCQQAVRYADEAILRAWYSTLEVWVSGFVDHIPEAQGVRQERSENFPRGLGRPIVAPA